MFSTLVILSTLSPLISNTTISSTIHQEKRQGHLHNLGGDFHDVDVDVDVDLDVDLYVDFNVDLDTDDDVEIDVYIEIDVAVDIEAGLFVVTVPSSFRI